MKIEAGKYYKTRDGKKAFVAAQDPFTEKSLFVCILSDGRRPSYHEDGRAWGVESPHEADFVEEWKDPQTFDLIVTVYESNGHLFTYSCFAPHKTGIPANATLLSRKIITVTEGEIDEPKPKVSQTPETESGCNISSSARSSVVRPEPHGGFNS